MATKAGRRRQALRNIEPLRQECSRDQMAESLPSDEHPEAVVNWRLQGLPRLQTVAAPFASTMRFVGKQHVSGRGR